MVDARSRLPRLRSWLVSAVELRTTKIEAVFMLDAEGDMDLGGTALKTNADVERARSIRSALAAALGGPGA